MAIENGKKLNVRIRNKYDSYDKWIASGLILEAGEIAIAYTTVDVTVDGGKAKHPALLMKVGDGEKTFANLPWLSAKAADVLSVCKNETELTTFVNNVIADAGIATNDAMEALAKRVTTAEGAIDALEALVGTDKVSKQIADAIAALNLDTTYEKVGVAEGLVDALANGAVKDNTDAIAAINNEETGILAQAKTHANGLDSAMNTRVANLEAKFGDGEDTVEKQIETAVNAEKERAMGVEGGLETRLATVEADYLKEADIANMATDAEVEAAVKAEADRAKGVEQDLEERLAAVEDDYLKTADKTELQGNIDTISGKVTTLIGDDASKSVRTIANEELAKQLITEDAAENLNSLEEIAAWIQTHPGDAAAMNAAIVALQNQMKGIDAGEGTVKKYVDDAIAALNVGQYALAADLTTLAGRVTTAENKLQNIEDGAQVNVIETVKVNGVALTPDASKAVDVTVPTGALAAKDKVAKTDLDEALTTELDAKATEADLTTAEGRITALENANKEGGAVATAIKAAQDAADAAQANVDDLAALVGNETVSKQIDDKIAALDLTNTYEAKGTAATEAGKVQTALDTYKTDNDQAVAAVKATADTAVQTVTAAADGGLKATRAEGSNDVVIAIDETLTFVLDCGTSAQE